jgi:hypothetical protein
MLKAVKKLTTIIKNTATSGWTLIGGVYVGE